MIVWSLQQFLYNMMKEWMTIKLFFIKYTSLYYSIGLKLAVSMGKTGRRRSRTQIGGELLCRTFLNPRCDSIFRTLRLWFLDERFLIGSVVGYCPTSWVAPWTASALSWLWVQLADRHFVSDRVYLYIYHFIRPTHSGCDSRDLFPLVNSRELSLGNHFVYTAGTFCPRVPSLTVLSKVNIQYNLGTFLTFR